MLRLRFVLTCFLCCAYSFVFSQFTDNFTDGNFTANPIWSGNTTVWEVLTGELHLNNPTPAASNVSYLSTASPVVCNGQWEWNLRLNFVPSGTNLVDVYIVSDLANLTGTLNGYCVRIGGANRQVTFHSVTNGVKSAALISGPINTISTTNIKVRVTRTGAGIWEAFLDNTAGNGTAYVSQGTTTSLLYTSSAFFGVSSNYTTTRNTWCFFDNFAVTGVACPDTTKPTVISVVPNSPTTGTVTFSERVQLATAQNPANYLFNNSFNPASATVVVGDTTKINLNLGANSFTNCGADSVRIANVQDRAGNVAVTDTLPAIYFVPGTATYKSVVINEIFADQSPPPTCFPAFEFVEIHNRSSFPVDLQNWTFFNSGVHTITTTSHPLCPGDYAILCANASQFPGYNNVIAVPSFGTLTNTGEPLSLRSATNVLVDSVNYSDTWYQDVTKAVGAWSLELINPNDTCSPTWIASNDSCGSTVAEGGATLGAQNSVYNLAPDLTAPQINSIAVSGANMITVCFTEPVTSGGSTLGNYAVSPSLGSVTSAIMTPGNNCVALTFAQPIDTFVLYTLTISNLQDCHGNAASDTDDFLISGPVSFRTVIFNEVYFDLSPVAVGLPSVEYVELYNRSTFPVNLSGWKFRDRGVTQHTLSDYVLMPGAYVLLTDILDTAAFSGLPYMGVPSFPALDDSGDSLSLRDQYGNEEDIADYDISWYHDPNKDGGGWSIELKNPNDTCNSASNWAASTDPDGGTPAALNSVYSTIPDTDPPHISSVTVTGPNSLQVCFDQSITASSGSTLGNYAVTPTLGQPTVATVLGPTNTCVNLTFAGAINPGIVYTLTATGIEDCNANNAPTNINFLISPPANWRDVIINEIFFDPDTNATNLPNIEYAELYNRGSAPFDLVGWKFRDTGSPHTLGNYVLQPGDYVILCKESDTAAYSGLPYLGMSAWPSLNNTGDNLGLRDVAGTLIDSVQYLAPLWYHDGSKDGGGWSIELINPDDSCNAVNNWAASTDPDGGTPGAINSIFSTVPDTRAPHIMSVTVIATDTVQVCFDEGLDAGTANMAANYTVNNGLVVSSATLITPANSCVLLAFTTPIDTGTVYTVTATGVEDCAGNDTTTTGIFVINGRAPYRAVVINEIMADPDPVVGQPNFEYLELYNRSSTAWDLNGWTLHNGGRRYMGSYVLLPNAYVILVKESDTANFAGLPYLGLSSWPGLTNGGDELGLRDAYGYPVDTVGYDISWYQDSNKDDGGWSLELINPSDSCALLGNWIASNDGTGGTPGRVNSVYNASPDLTPPTLLAATVVGTNRVQLCFNETMELGALLLASNYAVDNGVGTPSLVTLLPGTGDACVELLLPTVIDTGTIYTVTVTNMADCKGNLAGPLTAQFVLGGNANRFQIVFNEIYADETPVIGTLPEAEFVELYNNGTNVVSLAGWMLSDRRDTGTVGAFNLFPGKYVVLCSSTRVGDFGAFGDAVAVTGMPSLNNAGDSLELFDASGTLIDLAYYDLSWYNDGNKEDGGWSMERVDGSFPCMNGANWRASVDPNGATPGVVNSDSGTFNDVLPPFVVGALVTSNTTIRVYFNELMDAGSLGNPANYTVDQGIGTATTVAVIGSLPFAMDLTFGNAMDTNLIYCLSVTGVQDCPGNTISTPNSVCFGIAAPMAKGDLIINEILFNPYTGGSDFVELYNNSDKIVDLSELNIGEIWPGSDSIFNGKAASVVPKLVFPRSYVCLTADRNHQIITYLPIDPEAIYEMSSFPSYDDDEGECVIYTDSGVVLDRLRYFDDWSFPNLNDKNGVSLERLDFDRATQDQDNWHSAATTVLYATPGYKNSEILVPEGDQEVWLQPSTFSPDQDGFDDILAINYHFKTPDWNVRVTVFDNKGRPVRILKENTLIGTDKGTFNWDGTTDGFHKADVGIYVILFEGVNPSTGEKKHFRIGCVLAAKL